MSRWSHRPVCVCVSTLHLNFVHLIKLELCSQPHTLTMKRAGCIRTRSCNFFWEEARRSFRRPPNSSFPISSAPAPSQPPPRGAGAVTGRVVASKLKLCCRLSADSRYQCERPSAAESGGLARDRRRSGETQLCQVPTCCPTASTPFPARLGGKTQLAMSPTMTGLSLDDTPVGLTTTEDDGVGGWTLIQSRRLWKSSHRKTSNAGSGSSSASSTARLQRRHFHSRTDDTSAMLAATSPPVLHLDSKSGRMVAGAHSSPTINASRRDMGRASVVLTAPIFSATTKMISTPSISVGRCVATALSTEYILTIHTHALALYLNPSRPSTGSCSSSSAWML